MNTATVNWTDQVDLRPAPYQPDPLRNLFRASLITGGITLALGIAVIGGKLAGLPEIDPMADPGLVVDYAVQPPAERGLLVVSPAGDAMQALAQMTAPATRARQVRAEVAIPDLPELPAYAVSDIAAPQAIEVAPIEVPAPPRIETGPRPYYSLAAGDEPLPANLESHIEEN